MSFFFGIYVCWSGWGVWSTSQPFKAKQSQRLMSHLVTLVFLPSASSSSCQTVLFPFFWVLWLVCPSSLIHVLRPVSISLDSCSKNCRFLITLACCSSSLAFHLLTHILIQYSYMYSYMYSYSDTQFLSFFFMSYIILDLFIHIMSFFQMFTCITFLESWREYTILSKYE